MEKPVIWRPRAETDFQNDVIYLETLGNRKVITEYLTAVADAVEHISDPDQVLYQIVDPDRNIRRYKLNPHKWMYYRVQDDFIELLTIFDTRQDPGKLKL